MFPNLKKSVYLSLLSWVKDLSTFCKKKAETLKGDSKAVSDFFAGKSNAWFINSRFINFPARAEGLVSLLEDVKDAQKKKHKSTWEWDFLKYKKNNKELTCSSVFEA